jgi:hypothetical protein
MVEEQADCTTKVMHSKAAVLIMATKHCAKAELWRVFWLDVKTCSGDYNNHKKRGFEE